MPGKLASQRQSDRTSSNHQNFCGRFHGFRFDQGRLSSTPAACGFEVQVKTYARLVQPRSQASLLCWIRAFVQFVNELIDLSELFNFFGYVTGVLQKRISDSQIFRTSE